MNKVLSSVPVTFMSHKYNVPEFIFLSLPTQQGVYLLVELNWQSLEKSGFVVHVERLLKLALGDLLALPLLCFMRVVPLKPLLGMGRAQGFHLTQWLSCASQSSASLFIIALQSGLCCIRNSLRQRKAVTSFRGKTLGLLEASFGSSLNLEHRH